MFCNSPFNLVAQTVKTEGFTVWLNGGSNVIDIHEHTSHIHWCGLHTPKHYSTSIRVSKCSRHLPGNCTVRGHGLIFIVTMTTSTADATCAYFLCVMQSAGRAVYRVLDQIMFSNLQEPLLLGSGVLVFLRLKWLFQWMT